QSSTPFWCVKGLYRQLSSLSLVQFFRGPTPGAFMGRHCAVGDYHDRIACSWTDHHFLPNFFTSQPKHGQLDCLKRRPVLFKAQVMFPQLSAKVPVAGSKSEITFRTFLPRSPRDGAV